MTAYLLIIYILLFILNMKVSFYLFILIRINENKYTDINHYKYNKDWKDN
jgi:hypothetical protein